MSNKTVKRIITTFIIVLAIVALTIVMIVRTAATTRDNSISHMKSIAQEQTVMIRNYVDNAERTLSAYASANEIEDLLLEPNNGTLFASAQKYTKRFSATVSGIEGIYASTWDTVVRTHTNDATVNMQTRPDEDYRKELQDAMLGAPNNLYNVGILESPASGQQIVSMYKAVLHDGQPIGLVGLGIYTESLVSALNDLELNTSGTTYAMFNVKDKKYIFCNDKEMIGKETDDPEVISLCEKYAGTNQDATDSYESKDTISFFSYMGDKGWLLMITSPANEIFSFSRIINYNMIIFCGICIAMIIIFNVISIKQEETLQRLEQSKRKQAAITKNLHIAALKDILTDVNNRIKFIDEFSRDDNGNCKVEDCPNSPYCFAMFNLSKFSQINIQYGHDAGDAALASTADILKEHFGAQNIYRTGSDEFVAVIKSATGNTSAVIMEVNNVLSELQKPRKLGNDIITIPYAAAIVKKGVNITPVVLITLKELINNNGVSVDNNATYVDMDTL